MAEKVMIRASKWDVATEAHVETEIKHDYALPAKVDSCSEFVELNHGDHDSDQILRCHHVEPCIPMNVVGTHCGETEIKHDIALTATVDNSCIDLPELNQESHDCGQILRHSEAESCLPMNMDGCQTDRLDYQSGQAENNDVTHLDDFCENAPNSKQLDLNGDCEDGFKNLDLELLSHDQTMEYSEHQDKPLKETNAMSPVPQEGRKGNHNIYPTDGWGSSDRKRSRSFSQDSRSTSPSNASKHRWESWVEKCSTRPTAISGEKNFRRHEDRIDDERDNNEQSKRYRSNDTCFDFTRGRCYRGASCRYIHHETSFDGERNVRDELSGNLHNRRDGRTSFGCSLERQRVSSVPCKFFLQGHCRNGENCRFFHQVGPLSNDKDADLGNNILPITSTGQNFQQSGQNRIALKVMHAQKFASNSPSQQFVTQLPLNGQMLQSGQNPVTSVHELSGAHHFIASMQSRSTHPPESNPRKFDYGSQVQASLLVQSHMGNQQNHIVNERIQQNLPLPHNGHSGQILQNLPSLVSNGQIHLVAPKPPLNPEKISSDEKVRQSTSEKPHQEADLSENKPSVLNSDNLITHKFVTTEQAAKITDLSASLAQFFGTSALNSQTTTGSIVTVPAPLLTEMEVSISNLNTSAPSDLTVLDKSHKQIPTMEQIQEGGDASSKEAQNSEKLHNKEELSARLQNGDPEVRGDADAKRSKENKGIRMFKCALIELVKEMLKPTWKEGQLSKEDHNTIVKKVVDKVTGSVQVHNAPQTQEKIDLYLVSSKAKLSKLVQAYVEKYVGR